MQITQHGTIMLEAHTRALDGKMLKEILSVQLKSV